MSQAVDDLRGMVELAREIAERRAAPRRLPETALVLALANTVVALAAMLKDRIGGEP